MRRNGRPYGMGYTDTRDSLNERLDGPDGWRIVWVIADPVGGDGWLSVQVENHTVRGPVVTGYGQPSR